MITLPYSKQLKSFNSILKTVMMRSLSSFHFIKTPYFQFTQHATVSLGKKVSAFAANSCQQVEWKLVPQQYQ